MLSDESTLRVGLGHAMGKSLCLYGKAAGVGCGARTAGLNWTRAYSTPCDIMRKVRKLWGVGLGAGQCSGVSWVLVSELTLLLFFLFFSHFIVCLSRQFLSPAVSSNLFPILSLISWEKGAMDEWPCSAVSSFD